MPVQCPAHGTNQLQHQWSAPVQNNPLGYWQKPDPSNRHEPYQNPGQPHQGYEEATPKRRKAEEWDCCVDAKYQNMILYGYCGSCLDHPDELNRSAVGWSESRGGFVMYCHQHRCEMLPRNLWWGCRYCQHQPTPTCGCNSYQDPVTQERMLRCHRGGTRLQNGRCHHCEHPKCLYCPIRERG